MKGENMKKLEPFKVTKSGPLYRVKEPAQVDRELIDSVEWTSDQRLLSFDFKPVRVPPKPMPFKIPRKYCWRVACYSPGPGIKSALKPCPSAGITSRPPASYAEHLRASRAAYRSYLKRWGKLVPPGIITSYPEYEKENIKKAASLLIFKGKKLAGLYSHVKTTGVMGDKQNYVSWYELFPGLTAAERRSSYYQAALWLKKTAKRSVSVLPESYEKDVFEFFSSLGFIARRVVIERRA